MALNVDVLQVIRIDTAHELFLAEVLVELEWEDFALSDSEIKALLSSHELHSGTTFNEGEDAGGNGCRP